MAIGGGGEGEGVVLVGGGLLLFGAEEEEKALFPVGGGDGGVGIRRCGAHEFDLFEEMPTDLAFSLRGFWCFWKCSHKVVSDINANIDTKAEKSA